MGGKWPNTSAPATIPFINLRLRIFLHARDPFIQSCFVPLYQLQILNAAWKKDLPFNNEFNFRFLLSSIMISTVQKQVVTVKLTLIFLRIQPQSNWLCQKTQNNHQNKIIWQGANILNWLQLRLFTQGFYKKTQTTCWFEVNFIAKH